MPLTFTAAVLGGSATAATGTVTFFDGTVTLGTGTLNTAAQATMTTSSLAAGAHTLTARYTGDASYLGSTSADMAITVATPPDFTVTTAAGSHLTLQSGSAGTLSVMLQPVSGVLNQTINVAVTGLPNGSAINVTPIPVLLASTPVAVTIAFKLPVNLSHKHPSAAWLACLLPLFLVCPRKKRMLFIRGAILACGPLLLQGCGGGYLSGNGKVDAQSAGSTYPVVVTASCLGVTGETLTHSTTFTVEVQQ